MHVYQAIWQDMLFTNVFGKGNKLYEPGFMKPQTRAAFQYIE